jgi:diguanylate cyclase (GGDEF)-like protein/putative nucleotidyltransferase with HDIG domain
MPIAARIYIVAVFLAAALAAIFQLSSWHPESLARFLCFLILSTVGSSLKVRLPGVTGTMSVAFLLVLIALTRLSPLEVLVMALVGTLVQCYWETKRRPSLVQVAFNLADSCLSIACASAVYHWAFWIHIAYGQQLALMASALIYFVANTAPVAIIIALTEQRSPTKVWQECYFWSFPYYLLGASLAWLFNALAEKFSWEASLLLFPVVLLIYRSYRLYLSRLESEKNHAEEVAALHLRTIEALALAIDAKDHTTHTHLRRVQVYAVEIARELKLPDEQISAIQAASLLHDIGKLAVPEHIISKPGKLTPEEFEKMKIHPVVGAEILSRVKFPYPVVPIVRAHHEKWNGLGYPDGLKGEEIPIGARVLAAVDCLDALASDRQYRRALPLDEAMKFVATEAGKSFDPQIVSILQQRYRELDNLARSGPAVTELGQLSTDMKVSNGHRPATGFEHQHGGEASCPSAGFTTSIAAARQEAQSLFELAQDLGNSLSLRETLSVMASRLGALIAYDALAIYIVTDGKLKPEFVTGEDSRLFSSLEIPMGQGLSGWVAENRKPIVIGNPSVEPGYLNDVTKFSILHSALAVPLEGIEGVVGVLALYRSAHDAFSRDQLRILQAISSKLSVSITNALRFRQAETTATTDYLTALPNARSLFLHLDEEVSRARRTGESLAILVCDLDGFKQVNDRFGHLAGNRLLTAVAAGLAEACREYDYVARMGGDEFVMVLPDCPPAVLQKRSAMFRAKVEAAGLEVSGEEIVSMSTGAAYFPTDALDAEGLLAVADRAMYQAKSAKKQKGALPSREEIGSEREELVLDAMRPVTRSPV